MKIGLNNQLSSYQVASIRIVASGLIILPVAINSFKIIPGNKWGYVFLSGLFGNLLPAYLFCIAEEGIDSSLAGTLNSLTPVFVIITGTMFFRLKASKNNIIGITVAFIGSFLLLLSKGHMKENQHLILISLIVLATFFYGYNVNMVAKNLSEMGSLQIASVGLVLNAIPALGVLIFTGYFNNDFNDKNIITGTAAAAVLGIMGTAVASIIFYMLVKRAGRIFASMVTYGIPFVAIGWGILYGDQYGFKQVICLTIILLGVYYTNKKK